MRLTGYTDRVSVRAGEAIEAKVSCSLGGTYHADLVRIYSADPNPAGPGIDIRAVPSPFEGDYPSVSKRSTPGSYGLIPLDGLDRSDDLTFVLGFQPRLLRAEPQTLFEFLTDDVGSLSLGLDGSGLVLRSGGDMQSLGFMPVVNHWFQARVHWSGGAVRVACYDLADGAKLVDIAANTSWRSRHIRSLVLAAEEAGAGFAGFFNGRLEAPAILPGEQMPERLDGTASAFTARWDFSKDIGTDRITDIGPRGLHGRLRNLPARGVRGPHWSGREMCWRHAPDEYGAVHFHEGDFHDCGWETDFAFTVPEDLPSGVYGIRLRCGDAEDVIPFFVRPVRSRRGRLAVLFSTMTYQAYCNYPRTNYDAAYIARQQAWASNPHHPALYPQYGRSLYDVHADGSGVMFSSLLRPQLLMRPGLYAYIDRHGSGLRHFPADMHLIAWLEAKGIVADVVTDHDLDAEGVDAISGYDLVLTVTHPEYHTLTTLDALQGFVNEGGNFGYLGGNGFYWRVATSAAYPGAIEIRRNESGVRMWETEPGEGYHSFDGQYGGLWVKNDRPPQRLVGIGMSAQGAFTSSFYRRTEASHAPDVAWLFDGIEDEILGDFGFSGGGAAGFELDTVDPLLGTPDSAVVLASSEGHGTDYACVPEKIWNPDLHLPEWQKRQIRADLTLVPMPKGNFVFSTGSIMFCGSLPVNGYDNNISRLLENFIVGCLRKEAS